MQHDRVPVRQHISVGCGWEAGGQPCNSWNYGTPDGPLWAGYRGMPNTITIYNTVAATTKGGNTSRTEPPTLHGLATLGTGPDGLWDSI